jgi:hypothetical protein
MGPGGIASASVTEDPGSNPEGYQVFRENIAMLLCAIDFICIACVEKEK